VNALILTTNVINNGSFSNPPNILTTIPLSAKYGSQINMQPFPVWYNITPGHYNSLIITVNDQHMNKLKIYDYDCVIKLNFREKDMSSYTKY